MTEISMLLYIINILSIIFSVLATNENNRNYSIVSTILSSVLTVILSSQQGLSQHIISSNKTLNQYVTELKNNQNITIPSQITPTSSSNNLISNTPINTPINNATSPD